MCGSSRAAAAAARFGRNRAQKTVALAAREAVGAKISLPLRIEYTVKEG